MKILMIANYLRRLKIEQWVKIYRHKKNNHKMFCQIFKLKYGETMKCQPDSSIKWIELNIFVSSALKQ